MKSWLTKSSVVHGQRWDNGFHAFQQLTFYEYWSKRYKLVPLGAIIEDDSYGILTPGNVYSPGHPIVYIRVTDMRGTFQIDFENAYRVPNEYYRHTRARLKKHDILLAIKGASIASDKSVAYITEMPREKAIVNGTIYRFQIKRPNNPFFVAAILDSEILKEQIRNLQIPNNAVSYVDKPSIRSLRLPLPPQEVQDHIAQIMQAAYATRQTKLAQAQQLLAGIDDFVLDELGINLAELEGRRMALKSIRNIASGRFDFGAVVTVQELDFNGAEPILLRQVVRQINERITPAEELADKTVNYVGLGNIASNIGQLVDFSPIPGNQVLSSSPTFKQGDILYGRMRPYLNKAWIAEFDGVCSGEAIVLRPNETKVDARFLHGLLLSRITLHQVIPLQSGTSLPRVSASDVLAIKLPIPKDLKRQKGIGDEISRQRTVAKSLTAEAETAVVEAKTRVEHMILGEETGT